MGRLHAVLKLHGKKCKLRMTEDARVGLLLTDKGLKPDPEKAEAN